MRNATRRIWVTDCSALERTVFFKACWRFAFIFSEMALMHPARLCPPPSLYYALYLSLSAFQLSLLVSTDPKTQALLVKFLSKLVSLRIKRRGGKKPFEIQLSVRFSRLFGGFVPLSVRTWSQTRCLLTCLSVCGFGMAAASQMWLFNCKMTGRGADRACGTSAARDTAAPMALFS